MLKPEAALRLIAEITEHAAFDRTRILGGQVEDDRTMSLLYRIAHGHTSTACRHDDWVREAETLYPHLLHTEHVAVGEDAARPPSDATFRVPLGELVRVVACTPEQHWFRDGAPQCLCGATRPRLAEKPERDK